MIEKIKVKNAILQDKMYIFKKDIRDPARFESKFREIIDKDIFEWFDYDRESELYTIPSNAYHKLELENYTDQRKFTEAQTESGNWINNPWVSNKQIDYKIQVDYAF